MVAKKKKKPAANPARGFATTSVASKPKVDKAVDSAEASETASIAADKSGGSATPEKGLSRNEPVKELHELNPEELEEQLEQNELQMLVEKHAAKVRREAARLQSRVQTDRRVLRTQAEYLRTSEWLPEELMLQILDLAKAEALEDQNSDNKSLPKATTEEDGIIKLWTLYQALLDLGFSEERVRYVLKQLCKNPPKVEGGSQPWGFAESLDLLVLESDNEELKDYDSFRLRPTGNSTDDSRPSTPLSQPPPSAPSTPLQSATALPQRLKPEINKPDTPETSSSMSNFNSEAEVSDLESDLEPDELISTYLRIKSRIFELQPDILESKSTKKRASKNVTSRSNTSSPSPALQKLQKQLQQIESDILFDQQEAEQQWITKRHQLARERTTRKALNLDGGRANSTSIKAGAEPTSNNAADDVLREAAMSADLLVQENEGLDGDDILGDMFSAADDLASSNSGPDAAVTDFETIEIRDFGKQSGMTPRRILEEALKARDPDARLTYKLVSSSKHSSRYSLNIVWSKDQETSDTSALPGIVCQSTPRTSTFTMKSVATPGSEQSEGYVSTVALFAVTYSLTKEDKSFLRLPHAWRDLYREFVDLKKEEVDTADRNTVKEMRSIIQEQKETEEEEGVVLTNGFRKRLAARDSREPSPAPTGVAVEGNPDRLKDIWKHKSSTPAYQHMLLTRSNLPIFQFRDEALSIIDRNQLTILCGETGCGKSTQLPAYILEHQLASGKECKIYCTEPRRISAISLAQRVSEELGEGRNDLGTSRSLVGYAIRLESHVAATTRLVYATVGIVLRMLESSKGLDDITHLIIDEVHERSIDTDFLLIVLRPLLDRRPELKVILMSATVDAQRFSKYLNDAPIITVPGRTFPVQTKFLEDALELTHYTASGEESFDGADTAEDDELMPEQNRSGIPQRLPGYSSATKNALLNYDEYKIDYELIVRLIAEITSSPQTSMYSKAFLVFLPGIAEIRQLNDMLIGHPSFDRNWVIYPLHSTISSEDQQQAFVVPPPDVRKIVISTNIAETGVTIPDITCVIDTGKHKEMRFDERRQLSRLVQSFISRANAKQRRGRAGRVQEGLCFHLFTRYRHDELMIDQQTPEMLRLSLQDLVMRTKICKLGDIEQTLSAALDPPSSKNIRRAIDALIEVDALTSAEELTPLGRQLAKLPLDAHLGKLVLLAAVFGCVDVAITIAAILSSKSPFVTPLGARQHADAARLTFKKGDSDLLTTYNAYQSWKAVCNTPGLSDMQFCRKNYLSPQNLANIEDLKSQLLSSLTEAGFVTLSNSDRAFMNKTRRGRTFVAVPASSNANNANDLLTTTLIATAFYPKILTRDGKGWRSIANNQPVSLHPSSVNRTTPPDPATTLLSYYAIMQAGANARAYSALATTPAHPLPLLLLAGADADWKVHAGVVTLDGNRLRFAVKDWRTAVVLKALRTRAREIVQARFRNPTRPLGRREGRWLEAFLRVFERAE